MGAAIEIWEQERIDKAAAVAAALVHKATEIHVRQFPRNDNPEVLSAIIQAVATTYAATVRAAKE